MPQPERDDEGNYILRGVAIWDEHEDPSRPEAVQKVDRALLELYAANTNRRIRDTKERLPVACGVHTPKPGETHAPPTPVGRYDNLRVGRIGFEKPRSSILADLHIKPEFWDFAKHHERRSIEVFPPTQDLDTLILLGSKSPARDLGPLTESIHYDRPPKGACVRYEMVGADDKESPMDIAAPAAPVQPQAPASPADPAMVAAFMACLQSPEAMQLLSGMMAGAVRTELATALAEAPEGEQVPGEGEGEEMPPELMGDEAPGGAMEGAEGMDSPPDEPAPSEEDEDKKKENYERMKRDDIAVKYERQAKQLKAIEAELATVRTRETAERYEKKLIQLQGQDFEFDRADVHARLMKLPTDALRDERLEEIAKYGRKAATGGFNRVSGLTVDYSHREDPVTYEQTGQKLQGQLSETQAKQVQIRARAIGYDAAKAEVMNGKAS